MIIQSKRVWVATQFLPLQLEVEEGKIKAVYSYGTKVVDQDFNNDRIVPGFIDIHIHGGFGYDSNIPDPEVFMLQSCLVEEGVTCFLPTTVTQSEEVLTKALENIASVYEDQAKVPSILAFTSKVLFEYGLPKGSTW